MDASTILKTLILCVLAVVGCQQPQMPDRTPPPPPPPVKVSKPVGLFKSEPTFQALGWSSRWEWEGARAALTALSVDFEVVEPDHLESWNGKLLVLPNARNMSPQTVETLKSKPIKLLATYMTSYRKHDSASWSPNNFALSQQLGVDFESWVGSGPKADSLELGEELGSKSVPLGRHLAMLVRPHQGAKVLGTWKGGEAAIVEGPGGIYLGEDLLCPQNSESLDVLRLLAGLINRLHPNSATAPDKVKSSTPPTPPYVPLPTLGRTVRVGLEPLQGEVLFRAPEELKMDGKPVGKSLRWSGQPGVVEGLPYLELLHTRKNGSFEWSAFRGKLELRADGTAVNVLDFEHYLAGVVPSEVPSYFPPEALKTMAVVARTFGLAHLSRHDGYDVCQQVHCQVYRGLAKEAESTNRAVAETSGQRLTYQGGAADTTFHALCGGVGADGWRVWPRAPRLDYLRARPDQARPLEEDLSKEEALRKFLDQPPDSFCKEGGRFRWRRSYSSQELQKILSQGLEGTPGVADHGLSSVDSFNVLERTPSGRAARLEIVGPEGHYTVEGDAIRWLFSGGRIGTAGLQSTLFYLQPKGDGFEVVGGGWGHGVGLCQQGAAGRAEAGQGYRQILEHYYPGTELKTSAKS